ncbi:MAG: F0F1 ATP synthase subunit B [Phycisphaerales bacterium]|jgi:F-type H+-transporting ATPase subunit b|nr:F0F1 ATP synthase subunit B [Phycisphaerales bacterium]
MLRNLLAAIVMATALSLSGVGGNVAWAQDTHGDAHGTAHTDAAHDHEHDAAHGDAAHADDHAGHEKHGVVPSGAQAIAPAITALVVFGIVFAVLSTQVWPKILGGLQQRENKIREEIERAEAARRQAADALEMYERNLAEARAEAQKMLEETRSQQQKLAAELKAKADTELTQMRQRAMQDIETAKRAALGEIYTQSATLATMVAGKILGREITSNDQSRLVEESLSELGGLQNN